MNIDEAYVGEITEFLKEKISDAKSAHILAKQVLKGAKDGLEISSTCFETWFEDRFKYQFVWLDKDDYLRSLVRALWLAPVFAGTDFGKSRQRDMAQVWTDASRGFLGEIAVLKFLKEKFDIEIAFDTRRGELEEFLPTDIARVKKLHEEWRPPNVRVSIKTIKFNSRWLDVPGAQIEHSEVFILVKIGILRHHFLSFLKAVSFLKDKLFPTAKDLGELNDAMAERLWDEIPQFDPIPAYIAGYLDKNELSLPIQELIFKIKGRKDKRIAVTQGIGIFSIDTLRDHPDIRKLDPSRALRIEIEPIIDSITEPHFLAHSGSLKWGKENWQKLVARL